MNILAKIVPPPLGIHEKCKQIEKVNIISLLQYKALFVEFVVSIDI